MSHSEERGKVQSPHWIPPVLTSCSWEINRTSASYVFTCALWSFFSSSCLINCFVSFSSFLLLLRVLFAYKKERGKKKGNQSISMPPQVFSNLPQNHRTIEVGRDPWRSSNLTPLLKARWATAGCVGQPSWNENIHVGIFSCICLQWLQIITSSYCNRECELCLSIKKCLNCKVDYIQHTWLLQTSPWSGRKPGTGSGRHQFKETQPISIAVAAK